MAWIRFNPVGKYWEEATDETDPATLFTQLDVSAAAIVSGNLAIARMPVSGTWSLSGDLTISGAKVNVPAPTTDTEAATKKYVDDNIPVVTGFVPYTGASSAVNLSAQTLQTAAIGVGTGPSTAGIVLPSAVPSPTTNALYNDSGTLKFNGAAIGSSVTASGTSGTVAKFTGAAALGDSVIVETTGLITITGALALTAQHGCLLYKSADDSAFTRASDVAILFNSEVVDNGGFHSTSTDTSRITVPTGAGGIYVVCASIRFAELTAWGSSGQSLWIRKGGSTIVASYYVISSSSNQTWQVHAIVSLAAGEYIECCIREDSGPNPGTRYVLGTAGYSLFSAFKIA